MRAARKPWLTFTDTALERAYRDDTARTTQRNVRITSLVALAFWVALTFVDRRSAGSPGNFEVLSWIRFGFGTPLLVVSAVIVWSSRPKFERLSYALALFTLVLLWSGSIMGTFMPDKALVDMRSGPTGLATSFVLIPAGMAMLGQRLPVTALIAAPASVYLSVFLQSLYPMPENPAIVFWYVTATIFGIATAYMIEDARRTAFAAQRSSDELLHNVLPEVIAERLKRDPKRIAERFEAVTVLFGDIAGFTTLSAELPAEEIVATLDEIFSKFDEVAHRHGLEKIKTIGDAYMVVGGVPAPREDHAHAIARMALEMREIVATTRVVGGKQLEMRIGIHSGPVVAGVIGQKKFIYDLWGDTVNTASRMESHGIEGRVHVSEATFELLRHGFDLAERGVVEVKGKGSMRTWFLEAETR